MRDLILTIIVLLRFVEYTIASQNVELKNVCVHGTIIYGVQNVTRELRIICCDK